MTRAGKPISRWYHQLVLSPSRLVVAEICLLVPQKITASGNRSLMMTQELDEIFDTVCRVASYCEQIVGLYSNDSDVVTHFVARHRTTFNPFIGAA